MTTNAGEDAGRENSHLLLVTMQTGTVTLWEPVWSFSPPNRELVYLSQDPTIPVLGIPKDYILLQRFLLIHVLCCFTHNTQKLETTNEWIMKMCYIYRIIHMLRKGSGILRQIDGARKKSLWVSEITDPKRQILDALSYMWVVAFKLSLYVF